MFCCCFYFFKGGGSEIFFFSTFIFFFLLLLGHSLFFHFFVCLCPLYFPHTHTHTHHHHLSRYEERQNGASFWDQTVYGVNLHALETKAREQLFAQPIVGYFSPDVLLTASGTDAQHTIDFSTCTSKDLEVCVDSSFLLFLFDLFALTFIRYIYLSLFRLPLSSFLLFPPLSSSFLLLLSPSLFSFFSSQHLAL